MPGGRPTSHSPETAAKIVADIELGCSFANACRRAGIWPSTGYEWKKKYPEFSDGLKGARANMESRLVCLVEGAARADPKNWKAAFELLRCFFPKRFNPRIAHIVQDEVDDMLAALKENVTEQVFAEVQKALAARQTQPGMGRPPLRVA